MAATLEETLLAPGTRPRVMADCFTLIDQELADKSGVSGTAVKLAYKTVKGFAPGYFQDRVAELVPGFVARLEPFWADFTASGSSGFGDYLSKRSGEVADALLTVTDEMAATSDRPVVLKAYQTVRGGAVRHVEAALPRLGEMIQKYA